MINWEQVTPPKNVYESANCRMKSNVDLLGLNVFPSTCFDCVLV